MPSRSIKAENFLTDKWHSNFQ